PDPWEDFNRRLDKARHALEKNEDARPPMPTGSGLALAWRVAVELMVAILVATGIGWAIDQWLGTRPWAMIVMFFLGTAAGMLNVWRAVTGTGGAVGWKPPPAGKQGENED
ncbi:MAG: AtpZ/AtpI family protein, partial [Stellaceae bacterium]